jgi:hypothetical protein
MRKKRVSLAKSLLENITIHAKKTIRFIGILAVSEITDANLKVYIN